MNKPFFARDVEKREKRSVLGVFKDVMKALRRQPDHIYERPYTDKAISIYNRCMGNNAGYASFDETGAVEPREKIELNARIRRAKAVVELRSESSRILFESILHEIEEAVVSETESKEVARVIAVKTRDLLLRIFDIMIEDGNFAADFMQAKLKFESIQKQQEN